MEKVLVACGGTRGADIIELGRLLSDECVSAAVAMIHGAG